MDLQKGAGRVDLGLRERPKAEVVAFGKLMAVLSTMKHRDALVGFQVEVYEDVTVDVPLPLLTQVVKRFVSGGGWRPDPGELLQACEAMRVELRGTAPFEKCENCSDQGWTERDVGGVKRMVRCQCWKAHQAKLAEAGASDTTLALPPARESDFTRAGD